MLTLRCYLLALQFSMMFGCIGFALSCLFVFIARERERENTQIPSALCTYIHYYKMSEAHISNSMCIYVT